MSEHRYSAKSLTGDYARAGTGLALTGLPLLAVPAGSAAIWVLGSLAGLFAAFALRTAWRQAARIILTNDEISLFRRGRVTLAWGDVRQIQLGYYSTRADRGNGWMQLTLKGAAAGGRGSRDVTIRLDSTIEGFDAIAARAADAARDNRLELTPATVANFAALGLDIGEDRAARGQGRGEE